MTPDFNLKPNLLNLWKWLPLKFLTFIYRLSQKIWLYQNRKKFQNPGKVKLPVVSIGNITVGGTGKTPMIDWLITFSKQQRIKPAVISRGYKSKSDNFLRVLNQETSHSENSIEFGDEPSFLFSNHPDLEFYVCPDRLMAAQKAAEKADIIFLDDAMQHRKIHRDLNLVLVDSQRAFGNNELIPLGPLREPLEGLKRADAIIYTRTNLCSSQNARQQIARFINNCPEFDSIYLPESLISSKSGQTESIDFLANKNWAVFSGIGHPAGFKKIIEQSGGIIKDQLIFSDHTDYNEKLLARLKDFIIRNETALIITTEKDWVKLEEYKEQLPEFYRLKMKVKMEQDFINFMFERLKILKN